MKNIPFVFVLLFIASVFTNCKSELQQPDEQQVTEENAKFRNDIFDQEYFELIENQNEDYSSINNGAPSNGLSVSGLDYIEIHFGELFGGTSYSSAKFISEQYPSIVVYKGFKCYPLGFHSIVDLGAGSHYALYRRALSIPAGDINNSSGLYVLLKDEDSRCSCYPYNGSTNTYFDFYPNPGGLTAGLSIDNSDVIISTSISFLLEETWCN